MRILALLAFPALLLCLSRPAHACSGPGCGEVELVGTVDGAPPSGTIPANAPALALTYAGSTSSTLSLVETSAGVARDVAFAPVERDVFLELELADSLTAGASLSITGGLIDDARSPEWTCEYPLAGSWLVTEEAPLPDSLGVLEVDEAEVGDVLIALGEGCADNYEAVRARVRVLHSESAAPWTSLLVYETWIDGERWYPRPRVAPAASPPIEVPTVPGGSVVAGARGEELLYRSCPIEGSDLELGLDAGPHQVELRARVPGTTTWLVAGPVEIELPSCEDAMATPPPGSASEHEGSAGCTIARGVREPRRSAFGFLLMMVVGFGARRVARRRNERAAS